MNKIYCYCKGCRFSDSHITSYHKCGNCKKYGHGQFECVQIKGNYNWINNLFEKYILTNKDYLPTELHCDIEGCKSKETHSTFSHHKFFELDNHGGLLGPDINGMRKRFADIKKEGLNLVSTNQNSFIKYYMGMGRIDIYKNVNGLIEYKNFEISDGYEEKIKLYTNKLKELNRNM